MSPLLLRILQVILVNEGENGNGHDTFYGGNLSFCLFMASLVRQSSFMIIKGILVLAF